MKKLVDIYGHYARFNEMYDIDDSWFGRVLIDDNNLFEGIVSDYDQTSSYLVFGYMLDNSLRVIRCPRNNSELIREYDTLKEEEKYEGICSVINPTTSIPVGECMISLLPAEKTREITDYEIERLNNRIKDIKAEISPDSQEIYKSFKQETKEKQKIK